MSKCKLFLCVLFLFVPQLGQTTPLSITFTGRTAQMFDTPGYLEAGHGAGTSVYFGGSAAMNILGGAKQFTVTAKTFIGFVASDFLIYDWYGIDYNANYAFMADFTYVFYDQTIVNDAYHGTIPNSTSDIKRSNVISLYGDGLHEHISSEYLDLWIEPGTYWLGIEGEPNRGVCYSSNIQFSGYTPVPEPVSMALFGMGLCVLYPRRKNSR